MEYSSPEPAAHPSAELLPEPSLDSTAPPHAPSPLRNYYMVYTALLALLVITVVVAQFSLGALGIVLAMIVAITKAALVFLYFMHLRHSSRLTWLFAGAGFVWLMIMFSFLLLDYISRGWVGQ